MCTVLCGMHSVLNDQDYVKTSFRHCGRKKGNARNVYSADGQHVALHHSQIMFKYMVNIFHITHARKGNRMCSLLNTVNQVCILHWTIDILQVLNGGMWTAATIFDPVSPHLDSWYHVVCRLNWWTQQNTISGQSTVGGHFYICTFVTQLYIWADLSSW